MAVGKLFVPDVIRTPADKIRAALDQAEERVNNLRGSGVDAMEIPELFDQIAHGLNQLEQEGADVRAERTRFETIQGQLRGQKRRFLSEVGEALEERRAAVQPEPERWWWYLDEAAAKQRRRSLIRILLGAVGAVVVLVGAWQAYKRFLAPPPEVRQAARHKYQGETLVQRGEFAAALEEYSAATALTPEKPELWLWKGVLHAQMEEPTKAQAAFETARSLYENDFDFILNRGRIHLMVGDLDAAQADAQRAIETKPSSGWGYYLRAGVASHRGNDRAAYTDLKKAEELAQEAGESELMVMARSQQAAVLKDLPQEDRPTATP
jgi:tetratricopeptide (TPR) repeat protein